MIHGARQSGKTTLTRMIAEDRGGTYASMDDDGLREGVLDDPVTFLAHQRYPLVIDEVQRGGDRLVFAVKRLVDNPLQVVSRAVDGSADRALGVVGSGRIPKWARR